MHTVEEMVDAHPQKLTGVDRELLVECIRACVECAQACTACADACLHEEGVGELVTCISSDLDCADLCTPTGSVLSRHGSSDPG